MSDPERLLLDEMFAPLLAERLRSDGFDVLAVAADPVLRSATDSQIAAWAAEADRRVVTENVRDFAALAGCGSPPLRVLFTSSRSFPRSRRNLGPLLKALRAWLEQPMERPPETWLR